MGMLPYLVIVPILIAMLLYLFPVAKAAKFIAITAQGGIMVLAAKIFFSSRQGEIIVNIGDFESFMGITLRVDMLSSVFIVLTTFVFFIAIIHCFFSNPGRLFWFLLFVWEALLIGVFLTRDLFNIFVLVEVATVVVSILIMYKRNNRSMYDGMFYLMVSIVVMQFYLLGVGYVYRLAGVLDMEAATAVLSELDSSQLILPYALIITAISLKCALLPLFAWLPKAHATPSAPTAVSALLSGLHIKSGVYMLIRVQELFSSLDSSGFFLVLGLVTGVVGFTLAIAQKDIKLILAYSTVSQVGMIVAGLSIQSSFAYIGSLYHIVNHALFKSALFLCSGIIVKTYGTYNINKIRGLFKRLPVVAVASILAILGITGAPLFNGSISKYFIMYDTNWIVTAMLMFINLGTITVFIRFSTIFFGTPEPTSDNGADTADKTKHGDQIMGDDKVRINEQATVLLLGVICFAGGLFGAQFIQFLFDVEVYVDAAGHLEKAALYLASALIGFLIYRFYVQKSSSLKRIRNFDLGFRAMCIATGGFFAAVMLYLNLTLLVIL